MKQQPDFDHIAIIYNPISTGNAPSIAQRLEHAIQNDSDLRLKSALTPTQHAGHAEELAKNISLKYKRPLIISVSGDGGYNEVINGVMNAVERTKDAHPVVAVVAAGNANDHRRVMRDKPIRKLIRDNRPKKMDLLHIRAVRGKKTFERYAHSYIGFGISPQVALRLNRHKLNKLRELQIVTKTFFTFKPLQVTHEGSTRTLDSLIFANINEMAKVLKFREEPKVQDGKFELIEFPHRGRIQLLKQFLITAVIGYSEPKSYEHYECSFGHASDVQLDGEVEKIPKSADVTVTSVKKAIEALY